MIMVLDTTLYDEVCQWLATGRWFSPATLVSSTNKTDRHDITEILLKVASNTINLNETFNFILFAMILDQSVPVGYSQYVFRTKVWECSIFTGLLIMKYINQQNCNHY